MPRRIDPAAIGELRAILALDALFTVAVVGALMALDAMNVLDAREAMEALAATEQDKRFDAEVSIIATVAKIPQKQRGA